MKLIHSLVQHSAVMLALACIASVIPATAQTAVHEKPAASHTSTNAHARNGIIQNVKFEGVPMSEVVRLLREQFPDINFVSVPEVYEVPVDCTLRNVTLDDITAAISIATKGTVQFNRESDRMISITRKDLEPAQPKPMPVCQVFNLTGIIDGLSQEEYDKAIRSIHETIATSLEMLKAKLKEEGLPDNLAKVPQLQAHRETKLLIVVGVPGPAMDTVSNIINAMQNKPARPDLLRPAIRAVNTPGMPAPVAAPVPHRPITPEGSTPAR